MIKYITAAVLCAGLAGCSTGGGKMSDQISNGVMVSAKPIDFFKKGLTGQRKIEPSVMTAQFDFSCEAEFDGRSAEARANASAQYSALARTKVASGFVINPRMRNGYMREVFKRSLTEQGCAPTKLQFARKTSDASEVMRFIMENKLLAAMMQR